MALSDELAREVSEQPGKKPWGFGRSVFLSQKDEIKLALDDGYSMTQIHGYLSKEGRMPIGYKAFTTYVFKYITSTDKAPAEVPISADVNKNSNYRRNAGHRPVRVGSESESVSSMDTYDSDANVDLVKRRNNK